VVLREAAEPGFGSLAELAAALKADEVDTLVICGSNPVYSAPSDLDWSAAQRKAKSVIRLGYSEDETGAASEWHYPLAHYLESWGDARTSDGTLVPVQPLVEPLFGGVTELEVLARIGGLAKHKPYELVRDTFSMIAGADEDKWKRFLHDGFLPGSAGAGVAALLDWSAVARVVSEARGGSVPTSANLELVFHRDAKSDDGRYNNNGWLQELPDPVTKMTWDNVILLSPKTAEDLGLKIRDYENNNLQVPVVTVSVGRAPVGGTGLDSTRHGGSRIGPFPGLRSDPDRPRGERHRIQRLRDSDQ
jgi:molybdopterin-containing oxidoreductase family iron-sulfur binding subunit